MIGRIVRNYYGVLGEIVEDNGSKVVVKRVGGDMTMSVRKNDIVRPFLSWEPLGTRKTDTWILEEERC